MRRCLSRARGSLLGGLGCLLALAAFLSFGSVPVRADAFDMGVDVGTAVTDSATAMGTSVTTIIGVLFALAVIAALCMWGRKALKSR